MKPPTNNGQNNRIYRELKELEHRLDRLETNVEVQKEKVTQFQKELASIQDDTKWIRKTFIFLISTGAISVPTSLVVGLI